MSNSLSPRRTINTNQHTMNRKKEPIVIMILRILLGCVFIFSGFTKAIDPVANCYQFNDYFHSFNMDFMQLFSMVFAYGLTIVELTLGIMMLFRIKMRLTSVVYLLFMCFFLLLTAWLALAEHLEVNYGYDFGVVKDCGCFGKAIKLSNLGTFLKNIGIIIPTIIIFIWRKEIPDVRMTELGKWVTVGIVVAAVFGLQLYCHHHLPIIDFSDWKAGTNVAESYIDRPEVTESRFVYADSAGNKYYFTDEELMAQYDTAPDFFDDKTDLDPEVKVIDTLKRAPIQGFTMWTLPDSTGQVSDLAPDLLNTANNRPLYIMFINYVEEADMSIIRSDELQRIINDCQANKADFVALTSSSVKEVNAFIKENKITYPIYRSDCDPVKGPFIIRDAIHTNPGIIYIQNGIVIDKWAGRDFDEINFAEALKQSQTVITKYKEKLAKKEAKNKE